MLFLSILALNRLILGLVVLFSFSLGLTVTIMVIGIMIVHAKQLFRIEKGNKTIAIILPGLSALVVIAIGFLMLFGFYWENPNEGNFDAIRKVVI